MEEKPKKRLGELLMEDGVLTKEALDEALLFQKRQGGLIGKILISCGYITEENLVAALGRQLDIPYLPIQNYSLNPEAASGLEEDFCRKNLVLAFDKDDRYIFLAMADPLNEIIVHDIATRTGLKPKVFISTPTEILSGAELAFRAANRGTEIKKAG